MKYLHVSVVVIGYNEEKNLANTFDSVLNMDYPREYIELIYVDSGSTDSSLTIAQKFADKVFVERTYPSSGRNRNKGLVEATHDIVHFIDGDVMIDYNYLRKVIPLFEEKKVQAIVGQIDEQNPSFFNRIAALENNKKIEGYTDFTSTGATYIKNALLAIDGYDERIKRGQETELGERFIAAGYKIWCTSQNMGSHNFGMEGIADFARKYKNDAASQFQNAFMDGSSNHFRKMRFRFVKDLFKLALIVLVLSLSIYFESIILFFVYTGIACLNRNKAFFKQYFHEHPLLVFARMVLDYFLIIFWWYGFFNELYKYLLDNNHRKFYRLNKDKLIITNSYD